MVTAGGAAATGDTARDAGGLHVRLREVGWASNLAVETVDAVPVPERDEVVIAVEACGVCHRDCIDRAGRFPFLRLPVTPGHEAVGRVVAVGPGVRMWRVGDRIASMHRDSCGDCDACAAGDLSLCTSAASALGLLCDGGYANHLCAPERAFYRVPDAIEPGLAAVFHCTLGTAYRGLVHYGRIAAGMRVLVTGANGGVGFAAVQIAARLGTEVVAIVRSAEHVAAVTEAGAASVIVDDGSKFHKRIGGGFVDVAMDCVGQPTFNASLRCLRIGGRLIAVGNVVEERVDVNLGFVITRGIQINGSNGATPRDMEALLALHAERPFRMPIETLPLPEADRAQRRVLAGGLRGRLVLVPPSLGRSARA